MAVASGSVLAGRYELVETIGQGGMAVVYRARRLSDGKVVAVKVLREPYRHDREFVERFEREAQAAASLAHPNVVAVLDSGEDGGVRFLVMEYVEGEDLKTLLRKSGPLPPARAAAVAAAVCDALEYAHARGIVHRDIKPQNILLTPTGQVKVTDFGIARALSSATITETGTVLGSVHYLAPEQAKGEPATAASDVYALGVVLYEMLTGRLPFDGESPIAVVLKHLYEEPPPVRQVNPAAPEWLEAVVHRALAKRPEERYPSVAHMRADLEGRAEYWRHGPTVVLPQPVPRRRWRAPSAAVVAAVLLVALASGMVAAWRALQAYVNVGEVTVPDFRGQPFTQAQAAAAGLRLQLVVAGRQYHDRYPPDAVVDQDPPPGQKVREGRWVSVVLSQGAQRVLVPDVTRRPLSEVTLLLEQNRLRVGTVKEDFDDEVPRGAVVSQEPAPGTQVARGTPVHLVVSKGPELVTVPGLVGLSLAQAREVLHRVGLSLDRVGYVARADLPEGVVVEQSPPAGTQVRRTQKLGLVVAVRPQTPPSPPAWATPWPSPQPAAPPALPSPPAVQATTEPTGGAVRRVRLDVTLPPGEPGEVRIVVIDNRGVRVVYRQVHDPGERVVQTVDVEGYAIVQVYFGGRFIQEVRP